MPTLQRWFPTTFSTSFVCLYLKRKMFEPTAHVFSHSEVSEPLGEKTPCARAVCQKQQGLYTQCRAEQEKTQKNPRVLWRTVGPKFISLHGDTQSCPHSLHSRHGEGHCWNRVCPAEGLNHSWGHLPLPCVLRMPKARARCLWWYRWDKSELKHVTRGPSLQVAQWCSTLHPGRALGRLASSLSIVLVLWSQGLHKLLWTGLEKGKGSITHIVANEFPEGTCLWKIDRVL